MRCFKPAFLKTWVATQMWIAKTMRMSRESLYLQLLSAKCTISLDKLITTNRITALLNCVSNFLTKTSCYIMLSQTRGWEPMTREPDVALLIEASGSFVAKHKYPHIKQKDLCTQAFKSEDRLLRDHYDFKTKIQKSESDSR